MLENSDNTREPSPCVWFFLPHCVAFYRMKGVFKIKKQFMYKTIISVSIFILLTIFTACSYRAQHDYYSSRDNYVSATGIVDYMAYSENADALYLELSELTPAFDDTCFKFVGDNLLLVQKGGIDEKIKVGNQIEIITAPKYFGDGYVMPIVAISINGESLLNFDEGYENLLKWLEQQ